METVEMDLMQAQIAELTTEVTRLQRSAGRKDIYVTFSDYTPDPENPARIYATPSLHAEEIAQYILDNIQVHYLIDPRPMGILKQFAGSINTINYQEEDDTTTLTTVEDVTIFDDNSVNLTLLRITIRKTGEGGAAILLTVYPH